MVGVMTIACLDFEVELSWEGERRRFGELC